jgi:nucleoid-associated protein YgaU
VIKMPGGRAISDVTNLLGLVSGNAKATLVPESGGWPVVFSLNPTDVSLKKKNSTEGNRAVVTHSFQDALKGTSNIRLELSGAQVVGAGSTQMAVDQLISWATPVQISAATALELGSFSAAENLANRLVAKADSLKAQATGGAAESATKNPFKEMASSPVFYRLPVLLFSWGIVGPMGRNAKVALESVKVKYKRFDEYGVPVWASFDLTLVEYTAPKPRTNPTSGGVPGRTRHVVCQGENVVQIANRVYGSPHAWRKVAEANALDDPLRVRPGRALALPPPNETSEGQDR